MHKFRQPIAVSDISIYICLIDIRSKSKEQLNERRAGLSTQAWPLINTLFISIHWVGLIEHLSWLLSTWGNERHTNWRASLHFGVEILSGKPIWLEGDWSKESLIGGSRRSARDGFKNSGTLKTRNLGGLEPGVLQGCLNQRRKLLRQYQPLSGSSPSCFWS